jgi:hypothetical protein
MKAAGMNLFLATQHGTAELLPCSQSIIAFFVGALQLVRIVVGRHFFSSESTISSKKLLDCSGSDGVDCSCVVSEDGSLTEVSYDNLNGVTSGWDVGGGTGASPSVNRGLRRVPGVG